MQLLMIPLLALAPSMSLFFCRLLSQSRINFFSTTMTFIVFLVCLCSPLIIPMSSTWHCNILALPHFNLSVNLYYDKLSWVMLSLVSFISLLIQSYASKYLLSDANQARFMGQLSLLTFSVILLMISGSLMTAFFAWQFIGLSLYLLLNHYHYDVKANKSAKKKFMINRVGDVCFLLAVIIALHHYGTTDFFQLFGQKGGMDNSVLLLIAVAVMTKSAQFPFHIWLIDTMEAPTPVSALMHAGVINAGGFLLARLSPLYEQAPYIMLFIFLVGAVTALLGNYFMRTQPDIKKQLAYSTMGQMGYMVMQCGLGSFTSAVFHLIAHGFFKATLFLSSGGTLKQSNQVLNQPLHQAQRTKNSVISFLLTVLMIAGGYRFFCGAGELFNLNPLVWFFISLTLFNLIRKTLNSRCHTNIKIITSLVILMIYIVYLLTLKGFNIFLIASVQEQPGRLLGWVSLSVMVVAGLIFFIVSRRTRDTLRNKLLPTLCRINFYPDRVEGFYRNYLIKPARWAGDFILTTYCELSSSARKMLLLTFMLINSFPVIYTLFFSHYESSSVHYSQFFLINVVSMTLVLLVANRVLTLFQLLFTVMLYVVLLTEVTLSIASHESLLMSLFQLINNISIIIGFSFFLPRASKQYVANLSLENRLPFCHFYMSIFLILLIGTPGTVNFINEFYLLNYFFNHNFLLSILLGSNILLLTLVVLHTFQVHLFNPISIRKYTAPVSPSLHVASFFLIGFNVFNGVFPSFLLNTLRKLLGG